MDPFLSEGCRLLLRVFREALAQLVGARCRRHGNERLVDFLDWKVQSGGNLQNAMAVHYYQCACPKAARIGIHPEAVDGQPFDFRVRHRQTGIHHLQTVVSQIGVKLAAASHQQSKSQHRGGQRENRQVRVGGHQRGDQQPRRHDSPDACAPRKTPIGMQFHFL